MRTAFRSVLALTVFTLLLASAAHAGGSALRVTGHVEVGSAVLVDVANGSIFAAQGSVQVTAVVDGKTVTKLAPVSVRGSGSETVEVDFSGPVGSVIQVGIISDDTGPL